jgi:hypothetical protein
MLKTACWFSFEWVMFFATNLKGRSKTGAARIVSAFLGIGWEAAFAAPRGPLRRHFVLGFPVEPRPLGNFDQVLVVCGLLHLMLGRSQFIGDGSHSVFLLC